MVDKLLREAIELAEFPPKVSMAGASDSCYGLALLRLVQQPGQHLLSGIPGFRTGWNPWGNQPLRRSCLIQLG